eukprot:g1078.t1
MIAKLKEKLLNPNTPLSTKYRVLFALKNNEESEAHAALLTGLHDPSTLLRHEVAYCLGQTQNPKGIPELQRVLMDTNEHPMVRHEAAEALGAICTVECVPILQQYVTDPSQEVRETCVLALHRINVAQNGVSDLCARDGIFKSVDPTPAAPLDRPLEELESCLLDEDEDMYTRYQALFALRNLASPEAVEVLCRAFHCRSALLKHEVAFVLGQIQNTVATESLQTVLENVTENPMVRHEAAEALGAIASDTSIELLQRFSHDTERIVADSCIVALDMLYHEQSGAFEAPRVASRARRLFRVRATARTSVPQIKQLKHRPHDRVFNFSPGPACLPLEVLEQAQRQMLNYKGSGMSVMELSHRGETFRGIIEEAESDLRRLLDIPENYKVLFVQGGASTQFSAVPLNLTNERDKVDYLVTGSWSKKAAQEAERYCKVNIATKGDNKSIPDPSKWRLNSGAKYVHYCDNETIQGVEFQSVPEVGKKILVADMSSNFCSKPIDISKYGVIYAGAQKNIGGAGVTVVIVRKDLVGHARNITPVMLNYKTMVDTGSLYNTPPCYAIYICGAMFEYLRRQGGLKAIQETNHHKATILYECIDHSNGFYSSPVDPAVRSLMNVPFTIPRKAKLEELFIDEAKKVGLVELKGHRSVGGMRASIYNSMPLAGVQSLVQFMTDFAEKYG